MVTRPFIRWKFPGPSIASVLACAFLPPCHAQAAEFQVTRLDDPVPSGCAAADCSLRSAILAANAAAGPDTITLPAGNYDLQQAGIVEDAALTGDLDVLEDLTIQGAGSASTHLYPRDLDRLFDVAKGVSVTIKGVSIENTVAAVPATTRHGGGIRSGAFGAGAEALTSLTLLDVMIDNTRAADADAIDARGSLIGERLLLQNTSPDNLIALRFNGPTLRLSRSQFLHNAAALAIQLPVAGKAIVRDTQFLAGGAENLCGGIVLSGAGVADFDRITVEGFFSFSFGVVCVFGDSTATLRDSTLGYNNASALYVAGSGTTTATVNVENSTIAGNLFLPTVQLTTGGVLNLRNATLTNEAGSNALEFFSGGTANPTDSIIAGGCAGAVAVNRFGVNLESPGNTCALNPAIDHVSVSASSLALAPLANNGGPTKTRLPQPGSAAIGASSVAGISFCPDTDQRGYFRAPVCDLGAVEAAGANERIFADGFDR